MNTGILGWVVVPLLAVGLFTGAIIADGEPILSAILQGLAGLAAIIVIKGAITIFAFTVAVYTYKGDAPQR